jgi:hypothetical protein
MSAPDGRDDREKHYRRHEERSLGRDVGAGQQQIKGGGGQRGGRLPFLDRKRQAAIATFLQAIDLFDFILTFCPEQKLKISFGQQRVSRF